MREVPFFKQTDWGCWFEAARMVLAYHGKNLFMAPGEAKFYAEGNSGPHLDAFLTRCQLRLCDMPEDATAESLKEFMDKRGPLWVAVKGENAHGLVLVDVDVPNGLILYHDPETQPYQVARCKTLLAQIPVHAFYDETIKNA
jgi:hypothetical protein